MPLQTISKQLCECLLLIEQKKSFVLSLYYSAQSANSNFRDAFGVLTRRLRRKSNPTVQAHSSLPFHFFFFSDILANWNFFSTACISLPHEPDEYESMSNGRQCIAQANKPLFTILVIGPNERFPQHLETSVFLTSEMIFRLFSALWCKLQLI